MFKSKYRICSFILVLSMLCGCIAMAAEPTQNPAPAQDNVEFDAEAFGVLEGLNLLPQEVLSMNANAEFTRAQFIETLFAIAGYNREKYLSAEMPFIDVSADSPYRNAICGFYNLGFISGTGNGRFSPDDPITYGQAAKLAIDVLGYKKYAEKKYEGTNAPYIVMAKNLGLMPAISIQMQDKPLCAAEAVSILYNTARCDIMEVNTIDSAGNVGYAVMDGVELLQRLNKIYYGKGILLNNGIVSLNSNSVDKNVVYIGSKKLDTYDFDVTDMIGYSVKYFYKDLEKNDLLLYAMRDEENSDVVQLKSDQLLINDPAYSRTNIVCDVNGKKTEYKIDNYADVVYNNARDNVRLDFKLHSGWMRLVDNNSDGVFNYVIMEEYENLFITSVSKESDYLYDKYGNTINLKDYSNIKVFMRGVEVDFSEIPINRVISAVKSGDKSNLFLYVNEAGIQSELQMITNRNGKTYYKFENEEYCFSHSYEQRRKNPEGYYITKFEIGGVYTIYLDRDGKIAEADGSTADKLVYAMVIGSKLSDEAFADPDIAIFKLMLEDGSFVIAETNKKVKSQGVPGNPDPFVETTVTGKQLLSDSRYRDEGIVKVRLNKNNKIVEFYYPHHGGDKEKGEPKGYAKDPEGNPYAYYHDPNPEHFVMNYRYYYDDNDGKRESTTEYQANTKMILVEKVRRYFAGPDTTVFVKYTNSKDENPYGVKKGGASAGSRMEIYDVDKNLNVGVVSTFSSIGSGLGDDLMIIEEVCEVYEDDEVKLQISGFYQEREKTTESIELKHVTYTEAYGGCVAEYLDDNPNFQYGDLKRGDVIRFALDGNKLTRIRPIARLSEIPDIDSDAYGSTTASHSGGVGEAFIFSKVYAVGEQVMTFYTPENMKTDEEYNTGGLGMLMPLSFSEIAWQPVYITIYDYKTEEISYGEMRDIMQYMEPKKDGTLPDDDENNHDVWAVAFGDRGHVRSLILVYY